MKKTVKKGIIVAGGVVAGIVLFNVLPGGVRIASTLSAGAAFVAGIVAKAWFDSKIM